MGKGKKILIENVKVLKQKQGDLEKEIEESKKEPEVQIISPAALVQRNEDSIVQAMSQVILRDLEIVILKNQNKILENAALKKEEERKAMENKCKEFLDKNEKLLKQLTGKFPVQGAKHIIWDIIIT